MATPKEGESKRFDPFEITPSETHQKSLEETLRKPKGNPQKNLKKPHPKKTQKNPKVNPKKIPWKKLKILTSSSIK